MSKKKSREGVINVEALDALIAEHGHSPEAILGADGLLAALTKALVERALGAELTHHRKTGRSPTAAAGGAAGGGPQEVANCRNGFSKKMVLGDSGELEIAVPRDRQSRFEPLLVPKWQKRLPGFDAKIIALYARGLSVRDPPQPELLRLEGARSSRRRPQADLPGRERRGGRAAAERV